jgi:hypothetical protein
VGDLVEIAVQISFLKLMLNNNILNEGKGNELKAY